MTAAILSFVARGRCRRPPPTSQPDVRYWPPAKLPQNLLFGLFSNKQMLPRHLSLTATSAYALTRPGPDRDEEYR